jgi:cysteine desulfurase
MIYLDNSATTKPDPRVLEAMMPFLSKEFGNASSIYSLGRSARIALEEARAKVAAAIGAEESEIVFTSSGTEANNHAMKGTVFHLAIEGKDFRGQEICITKTEHHAMLEPAEFLAKLGVKVSEIGVDTFGIVNTSELSGSLNGKTSFVSTILVNNETGAINPVREITALIRGKASQALIHTDAVQALGKISLDVKDLGIDMLSLSAHKINGPKGIGALFIRRGIMIEPLLHGGAQERNRRGSTENVALAAGFAKAAELLVQEKEERARNISSLRKYLVENLKVIPEIVFNSPLDERGADAILNSSFIPEVVSKLDTDALFIRFDMDGIAISNGAACTSGSMQPSHVLLAMGKGKEVASRSVRVSLSKDTTKDDLDAFLATLRKIIP